MKKPTRARKRKLETSQGGSEAAISQYSGGQGVHREVESEGFAENHRVVLEGSYPAEEPVGPSWGMVEPALWRRRRCGSPQRTTVCAGDTVEKRQRQPRET